MILVSKNICTSNQNQSRAQSPSCLLWHLINSLLKSPVAHTKKAVPDKPAQPIGLNRQFVYLISVIFLMLI